MFLFMMVSIDGFIEGENHDLSWHNVDQEFSIFANKQLDGAGTLLFGRKTYQLMENFWPSKAGLEGDPETAIRMNNMPKIVFSKTLKEVKETKIWKNVTLCKSNVLEEITNLKNLKGKNIVVLGSNNLCVTLLQYNLLDEIRIMVNPVVIGKGTPLFQGLEYKQKFNLSKAQKFKNGNILLIYKTIKKSP